MRCATVRFDCLFPFPPFSHSPVICNQHTCLLFKPSPLHYKKPGTNSPDKPCTLLSICPATSLVTSSTSHVTLFVCLPIWKTYTCCHCLQEYLSSLYWSQFAKLLTVLVEIEASCHVLLSLSHSLSLYSTPRSVPQLAFI